jgi:hypothetical protein
MTDRSLYYLADRKDMERHQLAFLDAFCGCDDCAARKEQSPQASGSPDLDGQAQTGVLLIKPLISSDAIKENAGNYEQLCERTISLAGALA